MSLSYISFWKRFVSDCYGREPKIYIRDSNVFMYVNFFFCYSCLFFFFFTKEKKDYCVQRIKKSSQVELKRDSTKLPTQIFERQETGLDDQ